MGGPDATPNLWKQLFSAVRASGGYPGNEIINSDENPEKWKGFIMASSNGNIFHITDPLWGESTGHQWILLTRASDAELIFSLICAWTNGSANNWDASDLKCHRANYNITVMWSVQIDLKVTNH